MTASEAKPRPISVHVNAVGAVMGGAARHLPAFLGALADVRPRWEIVVYVSPEAADLPRRIARSHSISKVSWRRIAWDSVTVGRLASRNGATALINLANYGPFASPIPSILYQRNALYFDPTWTRSIGYKNQLKASARRQLAFAEMRGSAATVVPSYAMAAYLRSWAGYPSASRIVVIPHAVDVSRFSPGYRSRWHSPVQIVSLGHGAPHKDQELLIPLLQALGRNGVSAVIRATIADEDDLEYVRRLRGKIAVANLGTSLQLVGRVDAAMFLATADVMVVTSVTESFCFPIIEAMASGVPIVSTSIPATVEILGHFGWYFAVGDARGAAAGVVDILRTDSAELESRMADARTRAKEYSWQRNAVQVVRLIEEIVGRS